MPYPSTINDEAMYELAKRVGEGLLGEANVHLGPASMGAEDFGFYSQKMQSAFFSIGTKTETDKLIHPLHSPFFVINEHTLPIGAALHAAVAVTYLNNHAAEL